MEKWLSVVFAAWFVIVLVLVLIGFGGGATLGNVGSIVVAGVLVGTSQRLAHKARRHVVDGDREPTSLGDLFLRLSSASGISASRPLALPDVPAVAPGSDSATSAGTGFGTLELLRLHRNADSLSNYQVWIDGQVAGEVGDDSSVTLQLPEGIHTIQLRISWCCSRRHSIVVEPSVRVVMVCHSGANRLNVLLLGTLGYRRYIKLSLARQVPG